MKTSKCCNLPYFISSNLTNCYKGMPQNLYNKFPQRIRTVYTTIQFNIKHSYINLISCILRDIFLAVDHEINRILNPKMAQAEMIGKICHYACVTAHAPALLVQNVIPKRILHSVRKCTINVSTFRPFHTLRSIIQADMSLWGIPDIYSFTSLRYQRHCQ
jgi:hypothetical protein